MSLKVFFTVLIGAFAVGQTSPNLQTFASARGAAYKVYSIIDHVRNATFLPKAHLSHDVFLDIVAAGQLSVCITEHAALYSGTLGSHFDAADNLETEMLDCTLIRAPAVRSFG